MSNLGWLLARKHPTADTIQAAMDLEESALIGEVARINGSLGELEKQKEFFRIRLGEIKEEQSRLIIEFPRDRTGEKTKRLRAGTSVVTEYYYSNFNYRSIGVRRGLGTPEVGGGIWLTEAEREVIHAEFRSRYDKKELSVGVGQNPDAYASKITRSRRGTNQTEARFVCTPIHRAAERQKVGTLRAGGVVWLTKEEFENLTPEIEKERAAGEAQRRSAVSASVRASWAKRGK
jgi:hypothetical protein